MLEYKHRNIHEHTLAIKKIEIKRHTLKVKENEKDDMKMDTASKIEIFGSQKSYGTEQFRVRQQNNFELLRPKLRD